LTLAQATLEAKASESEGLRSRMNAAEARVAELEAKIKEQPDSEALAAHRSDLQGRLSIAEDRIVDLEAELLIMGAGRQKIVAMHSEVSEELYRVKQECAAAESRASILAKEKDALAVSLAEARDQSSEDQARAENSLALVQTVQLEYKLTRKKLRCLRKRHHHYRALSHRYFQQLCCMARVRDGAWALGYCWGFSTLRHLYLHPRPDVDLETVDPRRLTVSASAIQALIELGREEMPDAPGLSEFKAIAQPPQAAGEDNSGDPAIPVADSPDDLVGHDEALASKEQNQASTDKASAPGSSSDKASLGDV
jgi:hypothetical protein